MNLVGRSLPLPVRVAAGIVVTVTERARALPQTLTSMPVSVASHVLQTSMRVQQQITELAIKGDDVLSAFRPVEEAPEWATFDEDLPDSDSTGGTRPHRSAWDEAGTAGDQPGGELGSEHGVDPWKAEEQALAADLSTGTVAGATEAGTAVDGPSAFPAYDQLSLASLRARLRVFSLAELQELLAYERAHGDRPAFAGMLSRRIDTVRAQP